MGGRRGGGRKGEGDELELEGAETKANELGVEDRGRMRRRRKDKTKGGAAAAREEHEEVARKGGMPLTSCFTLSNGEREPGLSFGCWGVLMLPGPCGKT
eukprot:8099147-Pyramimonas_sp.AAC.1